MKTKHIKVCDLETNLWNGGTTTQLYIYPEKSSYKDLDFDFRISTAKVKLESSKFTSLQGISRKLMILEGSILIEHTNQYKKQLNKFDVDTFEGNWETTSKGTCTDFNLMCSKSNSGEISARKLYADKCFLVDLNRSSKFYCIYIFSGEVCFQAKKIQAGEILILSEFDNESIEIIAFEYSELIITEVF